VRSQLAQLWTGLPGLPGLMHFRTSTSMAADSRASPSAMSEAGIRISARHLLCLPYSRHTKLRILAGNDLGFYKGALGASAAGPFETSVAVSEL
jgi:hypothetical protein